LPEKFKGFQNFKHFQKTNAMTDLNLVPLTAEVVLAIETKLSEIKESLPFVVGLSSKDRMKLNPIGRKSTQFVQRVVESIRQNPEMGPQFVDAQSLEKGYELYNQLGAMLVPVEQLQRMIADTMYLAGSTTHGSALDFYNSAKRAAKAGIPGAQVVVDALKPRFRKTKRSGDASTSVPVSAAAVA
jgi:hypothetical protein